MVMPSKQSLSAHSKAAQKAAAKLRKQKKEPVVTTAVKAAIDLMVFEGRKRAEAAEEVGLKDDSLRKSLSKPDTLAYLNDQMEVLRTSGRPRALHTMIDLLEDKNSSVKFKAAEYLDGQNRGTHTIGATQVNVQINNNVSVTPGYAIDLRPDDAPQIGHLGQHGSKPLELQANVPDDE